jgi:hypothetical protein
VVEPESFLVDKETHLMYGELLRAHQWGETVARHSLTSAR